MSLLDKASLVQIPSGYKEDKLYSVVPDSGAGDFTFARSSTGTRVNADGYIEEVPWNLSTYSEDFTNSSYVKNNCTVTADQADSPIGTTTADQIDFGSGSGYFYNTSTLITEPSTYSIYVKYIDFQFLQLISSGDGNHYANFDIQNGVLGDTGSQSTSSIEDIGNGWYRCMIYYNEGTFAGTTRLYKIPSLNVGYASGGGNNGSFYFWGNQLNKGTSVKPYVKTTDRLDIPRLDYSDGTCPSLLLEPQRTNLNILSNSNFIANQGTISYNNTTSPEGITNAYRATATGTSSSFVRSLNIAFTDPSAFSVFLKHGNNEWVQIINAGNVNHYVNVNIENGDLGTFGSNTSNLLVEDYGNGWYRVSGKFSGWSGLSTLRVYMANSSSSNWASTTTTIGNYYYGYGFQVEANASFATSYIPTSGSTTTRTEDVCKNAGTSATFNDSEGVLFVEIKALSDLVEGRLSINNGSNLQTIQIRQSGTVSNQYNIGFSNGTLNKFIVVDDITQYNKIAVSYNSSEAKIYINGIEVATDNSITTPIGLDRLSFDRGDNSFFYYGKVKQLIYFNEALTDEELAALTTI